MKTPIAVYAFFADMIQVIGAVLVAALLSLNADARTQTSLNANWQFLGHDVAAASDVGFDASSWKVIDLPHSFNAHDVRSAGDADAITKPNGPYRGPVWYRHSFDVKRMAGQHYYLQFDGATLVADVYVNGQSVGRHEGGYAGFRFDISSVLKDGTNLIAVRVDNTKTSQIAPLEGDFNIFGGLNRSVSLITVPDIHIDLKDHGGPGIYVTTKAISHDSADIIIHALISNDGVTAKTKVRTRIFNADGKVVAQALTRQTVANGASHAVDFTLKVNAPHLWQGRKSPYLYQVQVSTGTDAGIDTVSAPLGIRTLTVDAKNGFLLNGQRYRIYGTNMQQPGRPGKGTAVSDVEIDADMNILNDLGITGMRLAHMQHPQRVYDDADRYGILVTTEVPLVNQVMSGDGFRDNINEQMRELIAQNYNHPSVSIWGLGNELRDNSSTANAVVASLAATAKAMDTTRPTFYAHCCLADDDPVAMHGDIVSYNRYSGWYNGEITDIGKWADDLHAQFPDRIIAISEYGAGGSVKQQEDPPARTQPTSSWHPEQYQTAFHEFYWKQFSTRPWLIHDFIWVAFDFPSYFRNEGDRPAINDKGLVTEDRTTKKDSYYWYQANWSDKPMVHITSARFVKRRIQAATVKVYSNVTEVQLSLNGQALPPQPVVEHIATWKIKLATGDNEIIASAGKDLRDVVHWNYYDVVE